MCLIKSSKTQGQTGAALLVFMLILVVSASTFLLTKLNSSIRHSAYNPATIIALNEAKEALIAWAVNHPRNPGTLPFPDRKETTNPNYDGYSDCIPSNVTLNNNHLLGRLPWRGGTAPCVTPLTGLGINVRDSSGEHLWYAVSKNLVYQHPAYPFISLGLLKKSSDWITVRDQTGGVISDRVAFVVIAPGPALSPYTNCDGLSYAGQDRSGNVPDIEHYLDSVTISGVTYSNANYDQDFIMYPDSRTTTGSSTLEKCDAFNDQLVFVTIDELMNAVSIRVLNETASALTSYHNANGSMPWLVPFADPKAEPRVLTGTARLASNNLVDDTVDFGQWGIKKDDTSVVPPIQGDTVWNLTDGSRGVVTDIDTSTLTIGSGLKFGINNTFAVGDKYYVETSEIASKLTGKASSGTADLKLVDGARNFEKLGILSGDIIDNLSDGSSGVIDRVDGNSVFVVSLGGGNNTGIASAGSANLILKDVTHNFEVLGISAGDIVDNLTDNSSGVISLVNDDEISVLMLNGGSNNVFQPGDKYLIRSDNIFKVDDNYRIRSNTGQATATNADPLILEDTKVDYIVMGIQRNDIVNNVTTGAVGRVTNIISETQLEVDALKYGSNSMFKSEDYYFISRYNGREDTKSGFIPTHQKGQVFPTGFSIDWYSPNSGGSVATTLATDDDYIKNLREWAGASSGYSGTITVDEANSKCVWISAEIVSCKGIFTDTNASFLTGIATTSSSGATLYDTNTNFPLKLGVKRGDLLVDHENSVGIVSALTGNNQINGVSITTVPSVPALDFSVDKSYRVKTATKQKSGTSLSPYSFYDTSTGTFTVTVEDATDIEIGDTIENTTVGGIGRIKAISGNLLTVTRLIGGAFGDICPNPAVAGCSPVPEQYIIHYDFVDKREYEFNIVFKGTVVTNNIANVRTRTVCTGYAASCSTATNSSVLKGDGTTAFVTIRDYEGVTEVGRATNILPFAGLSGRSLRISNLEFYLIDEIDGITNGTIKCPDMPNWFVCGDLPDWFIRNKWHQYILVAYNSDDAPGGATCIPGDLNYPCLTLNMRNTDNAIVSLQNNIRVVVMLSKDALTSQAWANARAFDYFENDQVASNGSNNLTLVDSDKDFVKAGVVVGDMILNRTDGSKGIIRSVSQTEINVDSMRGGDANVFNPGDRYSIDSLYSSDPNNYPFNKYIESSSFNDLMRVAVSCESDASKLCWSN